MSIALFDLDNTLLNGDSDHSWGRFLAQIGAVNPALHQQKSDFFYQQYCQGKLDINAFFDFQLAPLRQHEPAQLHTWRDIFLKEKIHPMIQSGKSALINKHQALQHTIIIITATCDFISRPIATLLGVDILISPEVDCIDKRYTGKIKGMHCYQNGKVEKLQHWLSLHQKNLQNSWFYTDSYNDITLLKKVTHPICVTPDDTLRKYAIQNLWPIID